MATLTALAPDPLTPGYRLVEVDRGRFASLPAEPLEMLGLRVGVELDPPTLARLQDLADCRRYEDAARLRDRIEALEGVVRQLGRVERLRRARVCILAPALEPGFVRAVFVADGRVTAVRTLPPGARGRSLLRSR